MFSIAIIQSALELGCIYSLVAMALFLSFRVLNIADMTTDQIKSVYVGEAITWDELA